MIAELLDGRRPDAILVDCGPGSFTGVRVGLAAAHGLAIGWGVPLAGYSSWPCSPRPSGEAAVAVALTGGHGELFVQSYGGDPLRPLDALRSLAPIEAAAAVAAETGHRLGRRGALVARARPWPGDRRLPRAADARLLPEPLRSLPPRPIYGRAPDARPMT